MCLQRPEKAFDDRCVTSVPGDVITRGWQVAINQTLSTLERATLPFLRLPPPRNEVKTTRPTPEAGDQAYNPASNGEELRGLERKRQLPSPDVPSIEPCLAVLHVLLGPAFIVRDKFLTG